jgi:RimJ/RimL family protein N-acetyltransferase
MVAFGFTELRLHRIWSWCIADHVGSARVLEKLGMRAKDTCARTSFSRVAGGIR